MIRNLLHPDWQYVGGWYEGVLGSAVPSAGEDGPSILYNDLEFDDLPLRVRAQIVIPPANAVAFTMLEDGSFVYQGLANVSDSFTYQPWLDGVEVGTPKTVTLTIGTITSQPGGIPVTVTFGSPASAVSAPTLTSMPDGLAVTVGIGMPITTFPSESVSAPDGIAVTIGFGVPTTSVLGWNEITNTITIWTEV